ncbi:MAG: alpha/beta hydrolase [Spirochaetota bacterium]
MKKLITTFLIAGCIFLTVTCTSSQPPAELISKRPYKEVELLTVYSPAVEDNLIGEKATRYLTVYLPPDYHTSDRLYPVVYFLHGYGYSVFQMVDCAKEVLNNHFTSHPETAFILVGVDGRNKYDGSFWANSPITGKWANHVVEEIPSLINANYRIKTGPKNTGIAGFSMGGFAALHLGMQHPNKFGHIHSISPPLYMEPIELQAGTRMKAIICAFVPEYILSETGNNVDPYRLKHHVDRLIPEQSVISMIDQNFGRSYLTKMVNKYSKAHNGSQRISIEYGKYDRKRFVRIGSEAFSNLLKTKGIEHELTVFDGGHAASTRIEPSFLPFFIEAFTKD